MKFPLSVTILIKGATMQAELYKALFTPFSASIKTIPSKPKFQISPPLYHAPPTYIKFQNLAKIYHLFS